MHNMQWKSFISTLPSMQNTILEKKVENDFDESQLYRANQLLLIDSKSDNGISTQKPLKTIFSKQKTSCNASLNETHPPEDTFNINTDNTAVDNA